MQTDCVGHKLKIDKTQKILKRKAKNSRMNPYGCSHAKDRLVRRKRSVLYGFVAKRNTCWTPSLFKIHVKVLWLQCGTFVNPLF